MSALPLPPELHLEPMGPEHLDALLAVEQAAYSHPWTRRNFDDALFAGNAIQLLMAGQAIAGYTVALQVLDEVHLLNLTVAAPYQRRGLAWLLLDALTLWSRAQRAHSLWLEVRRSNLRARQIYERHGFVRVGERRNYYPGTNGGPREDALLMRLAL